MKNNASLQIPKATQKPEIIVILGKATALTLGGNGKYIENRQQSPSIWHKN